MSVKKVVLVSLISLLFFSACSSDKKIDKELTLIMDTIIVTENNQSFYYLIESLLANEETEEKLNLAIAEINESQSELASLSIKTKKGKEVVDLYQTGFQSREKVFSILKEDEITGAKKEKLRKNIIDAVEKESAAVKIIIEELNIKNIED